MKYLPETVKILKKKIKKEDNTILVTSSSYSQDKSVLLDLQKYTQTPFKRTKCIIIIFSLCRNETKCNRKIKTS